MLQVTQQGIKFAYAKHLLLLLNETHISTCLHYEHINHSCRVMEMFSALLALCEEKPKVAGEFPSQRDRYIKLLHYLYCLPEQAAAQKVSHDLIYHDTQVTSLWCSAMAHSPHPYVSLHNKLSMYSVSALQSAVHPITPHPHPTLTTPFLVKQMTHLFENITWSALLAFNVQSCDLIGLSSMMIKAKGDYAKSLQWAYKLFVKCFELIAHKYELMYHHHYSRLWARIRAIWESPKCATNVLTGAEKVMGNLMTKSHARFDLLCALCDKNSMRRVYEISTDSLDCLWTKYQKLRQHKWNITNKYLACRIWNFMHLQWWSNDNDLRNKMVKSLLVVNCFEKFYLIKPNHSNGQLSQYFGISFHAVSWWWFANQNLCHFTNKKLC